MRGGFTRSRPSTRPPPPNPRVSRVPGFVLGVEPDSDVLPRRRTGLVVFAGRAFHSVRRGLIQDREALDEQNRTQMRADRVEPEMASAGITILILSRVSVKGLVDVNGRWLPAAPPDSSPCARGS